jgi:hypothetical protein
MTTVMQITGVILKSDSRGAKRARSQVEAWRAIPDTVSDVIHDRVEQPVKAGEARL